jgi:hypothetical protein
MVCQRSQSGFSEEKSLFLQLGLSGFVRGRTYNRAASPA